MNWLNYHHLLYFWTVVREGSVSKAAEKLRLSQPTVSAQVRMLEKALGQKLFVKKGRTQLLSDVGRTVYRYAEEIFGIGREMMETLEGRSPGRAMPLTVVSRMPCRSSSPTVFCGRRSTSRTPCAWCAGKTTPSS